MLEDLHLAQELDQCRGDHDGGIGIGNGFRVIPRIDPAEATAIADDEVFDGIGDFDVVTAGMETLPPEARVLFQEAVGPVHEAPCELKVLAALQQLDPGIGLADLDAGRRNTETDANPSTHSEH